MEREKKKLGTRHFCSFCSAANEAAREDFAEGKAKNGNLGDR